MDDCEASLAVFRLSLARESFRYKQKVVRKRLRGVSHALRRAAHQPLAGDGFEATPGGTESSADPRLSVIQRSMMQIKALKRAVTEAGLDESREMQRAAGACFVDRNDRRPLRPDPTGSVSSGHEAADSWADPPQGVSGERCELEALVDAVVVDYIASERHSGLAASVATDLMAGGGAKAQASGGRAAG